TSLPRPRAHTLCAGFITFWGTIFPSFRLCASLFCSSTYAMWHLANPYTISVPARRRWGSFSGNTQLLCASCWEGPAGLRGPTPTLEDDLALSL
ncbi:hypothetical protein DBR06_SOUSAS10510139, partial [Sousa chinensis]